MRAPTTSWRSGGCRTGIFLNPDFATGNDATSKVVLGVAMNGWHALSGLLVAVPAPYFISRAYRAAI